MSLRMVVCQSCELLYAPRIPSAAFLARAYGDTGYDSDAEGKFAAASYAAALRGYIERLPNRLSALNIGAGNGAFLAELRSFGFSDLIGIEPSSDAAKAAPADLRPLIRVETFDPTHLTEGHFSLIVANQLLEHIDDPLVS